MKGKILVVDDEPGVVEIAQVNLEPEGYTVLGASDGLEGLAKIRSAKPNLVILDIMMPQMDGWEMLQRMEADPEMAGIPVIMLTAKTQNEDILRGLEGGAVEYITKPFYPENLVASVHIILKAFDPRLRQGWRENLIARRKRLMSIRWTKK
jgi:two-component system phosphate regulon response regulator PhoB